MIFDAEAYAEGISNSAAGSTIEVFVDTIDATVSLLDNAKDYWAGMISGLPEHEAEEREYHEQVSYAEEMQDRWRELRQEIINNPENEELHFGSEEEV